MRIKNRAGTVQTTSHVLVVYCIVGRNMPRGQPSELILTILLALTFTVSFCPGTHPHTFMTFVLDNVLRSRVIRLGGK